MWFKVKFLSEHYADDGMEDETSLNPSEKSQHSAPEEVRKTSREWIEERMKADPNYQLSKIEAYLMGIGNPSRSKPDVSKPKPSSDDTDFSEVMAMEYNGKVKVSYHEAERQYDWRKRLEQANEQRQKAHVQIIFNAFCNQQSRLAFVELLQKQNIQAEPIFAREDYEHTECLGYIVYAAESITKLIKAGLDLGKAANERYGPTRDDRQMEMER